MSMSKTYISSTSQLHRLAQAGPLPMAIHLSATDLEPDDVTLIFHPKLKHLSLPTYRGPPKENSIRTAVLVERLHNCRSLEQLKVLDGYLNSGVLGKCHRAPLFSSLLVLEVQSLRADDPAILPLSRALPFLMSLKTLKITFRLFHFQIKEHRGADPLFYAFCCRSAVKHLHLAGGRRFVSSKPEQLSLEMGRKADNSFGSSEKQELACLRKGIIVKKVFYGIMPVRRLRCLKLATSNNLERYFPFFNRVAIASNQHWTSHLIFQ